MKLSIDRRQIAIAICFLVVLASGFMIGMFLRVAPTPLARPLIKTVTVTKIAEIPKSTIILVTYDKELRTWPLNSAIREWNKNDRLQFTTDKYDGPFLFEIHLTAYGSEQSLRNYCDAVAWACWAVEEQKIAVYKGVPTRYRRAVLCHELGHVLGTREHTDKGCMQATVQNAATVQSADSKPSHDDLAWLYWNYFWMTG